MTSILEHALEVASHGLLVFPLSPNSKIPRKGEPWKEVASRDPAVITQWFADAPRINYGVRTGLVNNLYVLDLDGPEATEWFRSTGIPASTAQASTPSGPDRTHHYYRLDGSIELPNTKAHYNKEGVQTSGIGPHVDTRGEGGYVVGPGSYVIATEPGKLSGTYVGDLSNIPPIPAELLAILPEKQSFTKARRTTEGKFVLPAEHSTPTGEKVTEATASEQRQIQAIVNELDALPREWEEGAGWRSTMYRCACWLIRMASSPLYAITHDEALALIKAHTPTDDQWGESDIVLQWNSALQSTEGELADPPAPDVPNLLSIVDVQHLMGDWTSRGESMLEFIGSAPQVDTSGAAWKLRQSILIECFRKGMTPQQALTVAWAARASSELQMAPGGLEELWSEVEPARIIAAAETGEGAEPPPAEERAPLVHERPERISLMTDSEREQALSHRWWGTDYQDWARSKVSMFNAPYHRMNIYTILSLVFSDAGFIPLPAKPLGLNLFSMVLGKTTTGKTEAYGLAKSVISACFPKGDSPNIGGDASPNSLIEKLIARDGKASWFNADEAHGLFAEMAGGNTWRSGLLEKWTMLYDGDVPMMLRTSSSKQDMSGIEAKTHFVMYLMGTEIGMTRVLDADFWSSGFLARYVWAIGEDQEAPDDAYDALQLEGDAVRAYEAMPKQWAAQFQAARQKLKNHGTLPLAMRHDAEALDRQTELQRGLMKMFKGHPNIEMLRPTMIRFGQNVRKAAVLIAMSEGSPIVTMTHELIAIEQAEEWLTNIVQMTDQTTATGFTRSVNEIERFIASQKNREVRIERVYGHSKVPKYDTDKFIAQLQAEGRITNTPTTGDSRLLKIKEGPQL